MTEKTLTALVGLHNTRTSMQYEEILIWKGYKCQVVSTPGEMLEKASTPYDVYIMDINLGVRGGSSAQPAIDVFAIVRERYERGEAKFIAVSATPGAVHAAQTAGVPAKDLLKFDIFDFLS